MFSEIQESGNSYTRNVFGYDGILPGGPGTQTFLFLSLLWQNGESVFTSAGISPTFKNFMPLTPFETLLVGIVLLQIFVFQLYGIVPFDLNKILHGDFGGMGFTKTVRKRRTTDGGMDDMELADRILSVILLTDHYDCVPRTLCEVEKNSLSPSHPPPSALFVAVFHIFKFLSEERKKGKALGQASSVFEEAVQIGIRTSSLGLNSTACEDKYSSCPLTTLDIMNYLDDINLDHFI